MSSIFGNFFGSGASPAQPAQQGDPNVAQPVNNPTPVLPAGSTQIPATPTQPADPAAMGSNPSATAAEASPLDSFKTLWDTDPNAPKPADPRIFGDVDPKALLQAASQIDFTSVVTPEMLTAIQGGGEAGTQALLQALNKTQQLGYAQSAAATAKLIDQAIAKASERFTASIPDVLKQQNTLNLVNNHPILSHPAAAPLVQSLTAQMQQKFPTATPEQLQAHVNNHLVAFSQALLASQQPNNPNPGKDQINWAEWANS